MVRNRFASSGHISPWKTCTTAATRAGDAVRTRTAIDSAEAMMRISFRLRKRLNASCYNFFPNFAV